MSAEQILSKVDLLSKTYIDSEKPFLNERETQVASSTLNKAFYSQTIRSKNDPRISGQEIGLVSFTPSSGATADKYGIYGVMKLRGNYASAKESGIAAERIIREVDSVNEILHVRVGETFPLTKEVKWTGKFDSVDLKKKVDYIQKEKMQTAEEEEEKERKQIIDREKTLLEENKQIQDGSYKEDPMDVYIRNRVALAQLKWTKQDTERKLNEEVIPNIRKREQAIKEMEDESPKYREAYMERYLGARKSASLSNDIPEDHEKTQQGFLKYMMDDVQ